MIKKLFLFALFLGAVQIGVSQSVDINPTNGNRGQSLPVVISGQNTNFTVQGSGTANLFLTQGSYVLGQGSQAAFTNILVIDPLTIMANLHIPQSAPLGQYNLAVSAGSVVTKVQAFTVNQGSSASITLSPNGSKPGNSTNVTITVPGGSFKTQAQVIEKVWLTKGTEIIDDITNITVVNSTTFTADVVVNAGASLGWWNANIYTDDKVMFTTPNAFLIDPTFSTPEVEAATFSLYPNPAHDFLIVEYDATGNGPLAISVSDITGKNVSGMVQFHPQGTNMVKADLKNLPDGVYLIQITANGEAVATQKFVKE